MVVPGNFSVSAIMNSNLKDLPDNDRALVEAVQRGEVWPPNPRRPTAEDLAKAAFLATLPVIRATTIQALCLGLWNGSLPPQGIRIIGVRIDGELDLSFATVPMPLSLLHCHIAERLTFIQASFPFLILSGSRLVQGLVGDGLRISGDLLCRDGFTAKGAVSLLGAQIGGDVSLRGAKLETTDSPALSADGARITGNLSCSDKFTAKGAVHLLSAQIGGNVEFQGAKLENAGTPHALIADRARITGNLSCSDKFTAKGEVRLLGAQIGGNLSFQGAKLEAAGSPALSADQARITGSLFCRNGFTVQGEVRLLGAHIDGDVCFNGAALENAGTVSLKADRARIGGILFCCDGFTAQGEVRLRGAQIDGDASFDDASLENAGADALSADRARIRGSLFCRGRFTVKGNINFYLTRIDHLFAWCPEKWSGRLSLFHAHAGQWRDNWDGERWGCEGTPEIDLRDFDFGGFETSAPKVDATSRVAWIRASLAGGFAPGPYETLARILRAKGDEDGAKDVALEKHRDRTRHRLKSEMPPSRWALHRIGWAYLRIGMVGRILDWTIGYGYRPRRGFGWLALFWVLGWGLFTFAGPTMDGGAGIIKPAIPIAYVDGLSRCPPGRSLADGTCAVPMDRAAKLTDHAIDYGLPIEYPPFSAFWYSLDTLIPLVDLGQGTAWSPSPIGGWRDDWKGWAVLTYLYIHIIAGWLLTSLTIVALTGIIKKSE